MSDERRPEVVDAPIVSVTLLEDRARVVRRATLSLDGGGRFLIDGVAPVIADKTLFARISGGDAAVTDARVVRRRVFEPVSPEVGGAEEADTLRAALASELRERERAERRMAAAARLVDARADSLGQLAGQSLAEIAEDVAIGRPLAAEIVVELDELARRERQLRSEWIAADHELAEHRAETERLRRRIQVLANPASRLWAGIVIDVAVERPADAVIEIEYVTPGALWRPSHTAELISGDGGQRLEHQTAACVWQNTGEDWDGVELCLSTERASLGAEPPHLFTDQLAIQRRSEAVVVETREQEVHALAARGGEVEVASELPGIDDGGAAITIRAPGPATIPSDGRPYRVPLSSFSGIARVERWAYPELSGAVIARSVQTNGGTEAVLAGPVELIRDSGWAGRTSVGYVAPGEEFELSWGPDADLRVRRSIEESRSESRMLSSWSTSERIVEIRLSNLGRERRRLRVRERIPVSEIEKVKIEIDPADVSDRVKPDEDGFLTWSVELGPGEHRELHFRYKLKKHDDVVGL